MSATKVEIARQRLAAAEAKLNRATQELRTAERKADTRKKIILGGALVAMQNSEKDDFERVKALLSKHITGRDRAWLEENGLALPPRSNG